MTIEEMRRVMRSEVVPEEVVPQNVINCLIDEDAEPPKPDAFSFLMRLRALGIGSSDFLDLLEGCDAPESVINKIRQNPAMNLQGLILTLDNSELTSDDYTRMLLTARQVWERTLTLRLEKSEKISQEVDISEETAYEAVKIDDGPDGTDENVEEIEEDNGGAAEEPETEYTEDAASDEEYDEDLFDMSFTAILNSITAKTLGDATEEMETAPRSEDDEDIADEETQSSSDENTSGRSADLSVTSILDKISAKTYTPAPAEAAEETEPEPQSEDDEDIADEGSSPDNENVSDNVKELTFTAAFDKIKAEKKNAQISAGAAETPVRAKKPETVSENTDEGFVEFDEDALRGKFSEDTDDGEKEPEKSAKAAAKTAKQKKKKTEDEPREEYEDNDKSDGNDEPENGVKPRRSYHKGAIIGATIGAAALVGAGIFIGSRLGGNEAKQLHYASDNYEIFSKIYNAYDEKISGGGDAVGIEEDHNAIFGDLLISGEDGKKGPGSVSIGTTLYSMTEEAISVSIVENGTVTPLDDLTPPKDTRFAAVFDGDGALYALFSGKQSGFMKISDGKTQFTVHQDGVLTSYEFTDGEIRLGTVYTPVFRYSFTANDESVYLPKLGTDEPGPISPQKVIISETKGYSYGVSAGYSAKDGSLIRACAVIGDPVAASADGRFALNGDKGTLIKTDGDEISSRQTERLARAAFGKNGGAMTEEGDPENIKMLDADLETASILTGITEDINVLRFDNNILTICCANSVFGIDCSDFADPAPIKLKTVNGIIAGESALTFEASGSAIVITRYDLKDGKAEETGRYTKELTAAQLATARSGDPKTAVIDGSKSGLAYSYFDGVSVISEYAVFTDGEQPKTVSVFDDKTGFTAAFKNGNSVNAICADGVKVLQ